MAKSNSIDLPSKPLVVSSASSLNHPFSFNKSKRLLTPKDFKYVFDNASKKAATKCFLLLAAPNTTGVSRLGVIVAKKHVQLAVNRNKFKRKTREHFRTRPALPAYDFVILVRSKQVIYKNSHIHEDLMLLWQRFEKAL